jgi:hypothetical protein
MIRFDFVPAQQDMLRKTKIQKRNPQLDRFDFCLTYDNYRKGCPYEIVRHLCDSSISCALQPVIVQLPP